MNVSLLDCCNSVVEEFTSAFSAGPLLLGDENQARDLLADAAPADQVDEILADLGGAGDLDPWKASSHTPDALLANFLKEERPVTAAFILSRIEPAVTMRVVALLPREARNETLVRLLRPPTVLPGGLEIIERALRRTLLGGVSATGDDNRTRLAEIINSLGTQEADDFMRTLAATRPQDARVVRKMLFSFQDLPRLSQRGRALLFDKLSTDVVVLALRGTDHDFREPVLSAMASRSRRLVESELGQPSGAPPIETEKARRQIVKLVLVMAQRGEIELPTSDEEAGAAA